LDSSSLETSANPSCGGKTIALAVVSMARHHRVVSKTRMFDLLWCA